MQYSVVSWVACSHPTDMQNLTCSYGLSLSGYATMTPEITKVVILFLLAMAPKHPPVSASNKTQYKLRGSYAL